MAAATALDNLSSKGAFVRTESTYRHDFGGEGSRFQPEADRYHLYVALACPWAAGTLGALYIKGLTKSIGVSVVHPTWQKTREDPNDAHCGWVFRSPGDPPLANSAGFGSLECDDALVPDTVNGCASMRDLYELDLEGGKAGPQKPTTPVLWDKKEKCIVNNESLDILRILNGCFNEIAEHPEVDLFPEDLMEEAKTVNDWVYPGINDGVYRCGFAQSQEAYDEAITSLFNALDRAEALLKTRRYILGDRFTYMDIRLYNTLVRFDAVYVVYFKCNKGTIEKDYPTLFNYTRDIHQTPCVAAATNMRHIKMHYFTSHPSLNRYGIIPAGGEVDWSAPHNRG